MRILSQILGAATGVITGVPTMFIADVTFLKWFFWDRHIPIRPVSPFAMLGSFWFLSISRGYQRGVDGSVEVLREVYNDPDRFLKIIGRQIWLEDPARQQTRRAAWSAAQKACEELDKLAENEAFKSKIASLPDSQTAPQWLSQNEIEIFKQAIQAKDSKDNENNKKRLNEYLSYIDNRCPFSYTSINELNKPITLDAKFEADEKGQRRQWVRTYDLDGFYAYIKSMPIDALIKEPETGDKINDEKHINIYKGFAVNAVAFINYVRETNKKFNEEKTKLPTISSKEELRERRLKYYDPRLHSHVDFQASTSTNQTLVPDDGRKPSPGH